MPTTKGTRAMPATVLPTPPALPTVTSIAANMPNAPIFNAVQRHVECEADRFALEMTHENRAFSQWQATLLPWQPAQDDWFTRTFLNNHPSQAERIRLGNDDKPWAEGRPGIYDRICRPSISSRPYGMN